MGVSKADVRVVRRPRSVELYTVDRHGNAVDCVLEAAVQNFTGW